MRSAPQLLAACWRRPFSQYFSCPCSMTLSRGAPTSSVAGVEKSTTRNKMMRKALLLLAVAALSACTLGPDYKRPDIDLPASAFDSTLLSQSQQDAMAYWWTRYRDPQLNELIDDALDDNLDIALQAARFREARAQLGLANANLFPSIEGQ